MNRAGVRWNPEMEEFELRCESCVVKKGQVYWPLTHEFWYPQYGMTKCRACHLEDRARRRREERRNDPVLRERHLAEMRALRKMLWPKWEAARREKLQRDPEKLAAWKAQHREASARYRARKREQEAA